LKLGHCGGKQSNEGSGGYLNMDGGPNARRTKGLVYVEWRLLGDERVRFACLLMGKNTVTV